MAKPRFQFSTRGALSAMLFVAIWCTIVVTQDFFLSRPPGGVFPTLLGAFWLLLLLGLPAATIGALAGHPVLGFCCGAASAGAFLIWEVFLE